MTTSTARAHSSSCSDHAGPARLTADDRRRALLTVAADLVVEHGVEALTMEGLAARAGVSKGLGYKHFANRDELLVALFEREMGEFDRRARDATADAGSFEDRVRGVVEAMFDVVAERGALLGRLLVPPAGTTMLAQRQAQRAEAVTTFFGDVIAEEFGIAPELARGAVRIIIAGANASLELWLTGKMSRRDAADLVVRLTVGGLAEVGSRPMSHDRPAAVAGPA